MLLQLYPNREIRLLLGAGNAPVRIDERRDPTVRRAPLVIPSQPSQAAPRKERKRHPLRNKARHKILHLGGLFSHENKRRQLFLTGTLPGSSDASLEAFTSLAPYVGKLVQTYLPRSLGLSGKQLRYLWVWELQKRGALHIHLAIECPDVASAKLLKRLWSEIWCSVLSASALKAGCDLFERRYGGSWADRPDVWKSEAEFVKKGISRYIAKYQSKGSVGDSRYFPPRWYGASTGLRAELKAFVNKNNYRAHVRIAPEVSVSSARLVCAAALERFCSGSVSHKHGYGDVGGVDAFGYLNEEVTLEKAFCGIVGFLDSLGMIEDVKPLRIPNNMFAIECRRMLRKAEREWDSEILEEFKNLMTQTIWEDGYGGDSGTAYTYRLIYWAFTYLSSLKGYSFNKAPMWWFEYNRAFNDSRSKFPPELL